MSWVEIPALKSTRSLQPSDLQTDLLFVLWPYKTVHHFNHQRTQRTSPRYLSAYRKSDLLFVFWSVRPEISLFPVKHSTTLGGWKCTRHGKEQKSYGEAIKYALMNE